MVTADEVLKALELKRMTIILTTQTKDGENLELSGYLRGDSDGWLVVQEVGEEEADPEELTLVNHRSIHHIRKALPFEP